MKNNEEFLQNLSNALAYCKSKEADAHAVYMTVNGEAKPFYKGKETVYNELAEMLADLKADFEKWFC